MFEAALGEKLFILNQNMCWFTCKCCSFSSSKMWFAHCTQGFPKVLSTNAVEGEIYSEVCVEQLETVVLDSEECGYVDFFDHVQLKH